MTNLFEIAVNVDFSDFEKVFTPDVKKIIEVVRKYNFDIRVVGGAVRDFINGRKPRDIDFATNAEPAELIFIFDIEGIEYDADGIEHGTIKAVFGEDKVDITSITYKMHVDNSHVAIDRNTSWEVDAKNRDLTMNSLSVDLNGTLYDYTNGIGDINNQIVRFCPNPSKKIAHDPNNILRWYKAIGYFDNPTWPKKDRAIVEKYLPLLGQIKDDKKTKYELAGFLSLKNSKKVFQLMCEMGASKYLNLSCS
jgi:tRNA nucleotidyltransferase/poly(A) polymerase